jgi:DNA (cytosine-5)-methyltransferase 1
MSKQNTTFDFAELFCGPGGLSLGAKTAKYIDDNGVEYKVNPVWANDIDPSTCRTYARNIHNGDTSGVYCGKVEELDFKTMPSYDALAFGFPCNDFSLVGEQKGFDGKYGPLYTYGVKAIEAHNPKFFIAENVGGLSSANNGMAFKQVLHDLERAGKGYELTYTNLKNTVFLKPAIE